MKKIYLLTDYKVRFGLKYNAIPYRSGFDKDLIAKYFSDADFGVEYVSFSDVNPREPKWKNAIVLYTSQEDQNGIYKSYIEDVIYALELAGAKVIPSFKFLRAHNNKVFMELLNTIYSPQKQTLKTFHFGTLEELEASADKLKYPIVIKGYSGAMSKNVTLARDYKDMIKKAKIISNSKNVKHDFKEQGRLLKHKGYLAESKYRNKFILQEFIAGLTSDWKILIFGEKYYIFKRPNRKNDFRASGSGNKHYEYGILPPEGMFDLAKQYKEIFNVPTLSLDILFDGKQFFIGEFQAMHFGTVGHLKSDGYFKNENGKWTKIQDIQSLEQIYVESIINFLRD